MKYLEKIISDFWKSAKVFPKTSKFSSGKCTISYHNRLTTLKIAETRQNFSRRRFFEISRGSFFGLLNFSKLSEILLKTGNSANSALNLLKTAILWKKLYKYLCWTYCLVRWTEVMIINDCVSTQPIYPKINFGEKLTKIRLISLKISQNSYFFKKTFRNIFWTGLVMEWSELSIKIHLN